MKTYYEERAPVYEAVYDYPERQEDLRFLEAYVSRKFTGLDVLEIAAGTGYWTQFIAQTARSVLATDVTHEVLEQLETRRLPAIVTTRVVDAYRIADLTQSFDGGFAGLWLSHVPRQHLRDFIRGFHSRLSIGAPVVFIDNSSVQCKRLPITTEDEFGNTYQDRTLESGNTYKVLKNFPTEEELMEGVRDISSEHEFTMLDNFWLFTYTVR